MNPKTKLALILLTPVGVLLGIFWFAGVITAIRTLVVYGAGLSYEMWVRSLLTLVSAGAFAVLGWLLAKKVVEKVEARERPKIKKRREK